MDQLFALTIIFHSFMLITVLFLINICLVLESIAAYKNHLSGFHVFIQHLVPIGQASM